MGNGYDFERYSWTQTLADATVSVPVPPGTKGRGCQVDITRCTLKVISHPKSPAPLKVGVLIFLRRLAFPERARSLDFKWVSYHVCNS